MISTKYFLFVGVIVSLMSCTIRSSFQAGTTANITAESIMIPLAENQAAQSPTSMVLDVTEALRDYYQTNSKLIVNSNQQSDLELYATITDFKSQQMSSTAENGGQATHMELIVKVKISYRDNENDDNSIESKTFEQKMPYLATLSLEEAQTSLLPEIIELLTQDIFNSTLARW